MEDNKEATLTGYPNVISYECSKRILEQMTRNICKFKIGGKQGTGFFCKIPFPDLNNMQRVLITNNHIIDENILNNENSKISIKIKEEHKSKIINLDGRKKYTDKEFDITIIEIKDSDNINNYLELDNSIINDIIDNKNLNEEYLDKTIYIIQYPEGELSVSYGVLQNIANDKKYNFYHKCCTKEGSSGSPVLNLNNKLVGIHKERNKGYENRYNIGLFLNYPIKKFIGLYFDKSNELLLKNINKKYNLKIKSSNITELDLKNRLIEDEGLKDLCQIEFKQLKELYLSFNNISDIRPLEKAKFEKLEILDLGYNTISDIKILEKVKFKELKELYLSYNNISDLKPLENVKLRKLEKLSLYNNEITDISILAKVIFRELKELYLFGNNISDINVLGNVKFEKLELLSLYNNEISDINILEKANFKKLKDLSLFGNNISDINVLGKVKFPELEILNLGNNEITDIGILEKVNFKELKKLNLNGNNISDVEVLNKVKFEKLEMFDIENNNIFNNLNI